MNYKERMFVIYIIYERLFFVNTKSELMFDFYLFTWYNLVNKL